MKGCHKNELIFYRAFYLKEQYEQVFRLKLSSKRFKKLTTGKENSVVKKHLELLRELAFERNDTVHDNLLKDFEKNVKTFLHELERINEPIKNLSLNDLGYDDIEESFFIK